jgi:hypothetical protein
MAATAAVGSCAGALAWAPASNKVRLTLSNGFFTTFSQESDCELVKVDQECK